MQNPSLLDEDGTYFYNENDFVSDFHRVAFGCISNLYKMGAKRVTTADIENYLEGRSESKQIYLASKGSEWLTETVNNADLANFDYYYSRMKKMTLLRGYEACGMDVRFLYNPDEIFDEAKKKKQEDYLDSLSLNEISDLIDNKILDIRAKYVDNATDEAKLLGDSVDDILNKIKEEPLIGSPLYGKYVNTIHRGARLGTYYIRSAPTNVGKTRYMVADMCYLACNELYDKNKQDWIIQGIKQPTLYITTEQTLEEVTTMCLAFIANVDEDHIVKNQYTFGEYDRILQAARILKESPLYVEEMPDFTMKDVENSIKRNIRTYGTQYIFFDYIQSSVSILGEIARMSGGMKLREDNVLFLLSAKLKDIATQFHVFVFTSTQVNGDFKTDPVPDQNLLRGSKAIADRADFGSILLNVTKDDKENIETIVKQIGCEMPNVKLSIYKNRGGKYNRMYLWMSADRSTCHFDGLFLTTYEYEPIPIKDTDIVVQGKEE